LLAPPPDGASVFPAVLEPLSFAVVDDELASPDDDSPAARLPLPALPDEDERESVL